MADQIESRELVLPTWKIGTLRYRPHIYQSGGTWWVLCKHRNRTGPYHYQRTAFSAAQDIWDTQLPESIRG